MDVLDRADLRFPESLPGFLRLFPDDAACAAYLERSRWPDGFTCPHCGVLGDPFRFENRPGVLRCRACRKCHMWNDPPGKGFFRRLITWERCGHMYGLSARLWTAGLDEVRDASG